MTIPGQDLAAFERGIMAAGLHIRRRKYEEVYEGSDSFVTYEITDSLARMITIQVREDVFADWGWYAADQVLAKFREVGLTT